MKKLITICAITILLALLAGQVQATMRPGSSLDLGLPDPFQIDLYEGGPLDPEFSTTLLPELVASGFVVLTEFPALDPLYPNNPANWSDIVEFYTTTGSGGVTHSYADFWSDKDEIPGWSFESAYPDLVAGVLAGANTKYLVEDHYPTVYDLGYPYDNLYRIWSIPEPATVALLGLGALSLLRRKR